MTTSSLLRRSQSDRNQNPTVNLLKCPLCVSSSHSTSHSEARRKASRTGDGLSYVAEYMILVTYCQENKLTLTMNNYFCLVYTVSPGKVFLSLEQYCYLSAFPCHISFVKAKWLQTCSDNEGELYSVSGSEGGGMVKGNHSRELRHINYVVVV